MEQAFLNYLIVTSGHRYGSLLMFLVSGADPTVKLEIWVGNPDYIVDNGKLHMPNFSPISYCIGPESGSQTTVPYQKCHIKHGGIITTT